MVLKLLQTMQFLIIMHVFLIIDNAVRLQDLSSSKIKLRRDAMYELQSIISS